MARFSSFMTVVLLCFVAVSSADEKASLRKSRRSVLQVESSFVESLWGQEETNNNGTRRSGRPFISTIYTTHVLMFVYLFLFCDRPTAAEMEKVNAETVDSNERELFDRQLQSTRMLFQF
jgi:hypothetical protein